MAVRRDTLQGQPIGRVVEERLQLGPARGKLARTFAHLDLKLFVQLAQPSFAFLQRLSDPLALVDVLDDAECVENIAVQVPDRADIDADPEALAGLADEALLQLDLRHRTGNQVPTDGMTIVAIVRVDQFQQVATDKLLSRIPKHPAQRRVHLPKTEIQIRGCLAERALFEHTAEASHAFAQGRFRPFALRNVHVDSAIAHGPSGGVADDMASAKDPTRHAIGATNAVFDLTRVGIGRHRSAQPFPDVLPILGRAQCSDALHRDGFIHRLQSQDAVILRRAPNRVGGQVDLPHADARALLRQRQQIVALAQRALHPPSLGDVADVHQQTPGVWADVHLDRDAQHRRSRFAADGFSLGHGALQDGMHVRARERRECVEQLPPQDILA
jgi:hypothetical protein